MTDENSKNYLTWIKLGTRQFFLTLITNLNVKFRNSKYRTKMKNELNSDLIRYSRFFEVPQYKSQYFKIPNGEFKYGGPKCENKVDLDETWNLKI